MANVLKSALDYVKQTVWDQPAGIVKNVAKGDFGGAFDDWKHTFGDNNDAEEKIFNSFGIRGWVGSHPTETAGAVVGSILGGMYAAGAYGAGAAGSAGASAGGAAGTAGGTAGSGAFGLQSSALASTPMSSFAELGASAGGASGTGTSALAYMPTQSSVLAGTGSQGIASGAGTGALSYAPTQSTVLGGAGSGIAPNFGAGLGSSGSSAGVDVQQLMRGVNQLQQATGGNQQSSGTTQQVQIVPAKVGNFNFQPTQSDFSKAQQLLSQALSQNTFNTNPFSRR